MFCPNCGQASPNDGLRFCRQCGFRLDGISQLLINGGAPLTMPPLTPAPLPAADSPRRKGLKIGAKLMLTSVVVSPLFFAFAVMAVNSPFPLVFPFTGFLAGLACMIYARLFENDQVSATPPRPPLYLDPRPEALPPTAQTPQPPPPRSLFAPGPPTNDLPQLPSVTEKTTGLLKR